jgi:hypothetical protein
VKSYFFIIYAIYYKMSSVEIRIKGMNVKGLKTKRGKARRKINRKKQQLAEKKKMNEYSYSVNRPYNYTSPIIPTYITRPEPPPQIQQQQQQIDYKPLFDKLALSMRLASDRENKVEEQNIRPPEPILSTPRVVLDNEDEIKEAEARAVRAEKKKLSQKTSANTKIRNEYKTNWFRKNGNMGGFEDWWSKNVRAINKGENIQIP